MAAPQHKSRLFTKFVLRKDMVLNHRIVYLPLTRRRATKEHVPTDLQLQYYDDRSKIPGSLLITEACLVHRDQGLVPFVPGIWNKTQTKAWAHIVDKVHANKSFIGCQIWAMGRTGSPGLLKESGFPFKAPSAIYFDEGSRKQAEKANNPLQELTEDDIHSIIYEKFDTAARNAIEAGFDFVELHGSNGYLIEQFTNPCSNKRIDKYGGSIENRSRFLLELIDHLSSVIGASRLTVRLSPWSQYQGMKGADEEISPIVTYGYIASELQRRANEGRGLLYLDVVNGRIEPGGIKDTSFVRDIWKGPMLFGGNFTYDQQTWQSINSYVEDDRNLVGFTRLYTSNPDLPDRIKNGWKITNYDRNTFYTQDNYGYNTFARYGEESQVDEETERSRVGTPLA